MADEERVGEMDKRRRSTTDKLAKKEKKPFMKMFTERFQKNKVDQFDHEGDEFEHISGISQLSDESNQDQASCGYSKI
jgi:hypothetical protein